MAIRVRGLRSIVAGLSDLQRSVVSMPEARQDVADALRKRINPPRRTGALDRSIVVVSDGESTSVGTDIQYAWPVHSGTRYMAGNPFMIPVADAMDAEAGSIFDSHLQRACDAVRGI